jgi:hypothetical protein
MRALLLLLFLVGCGGTSDEPEEDRKSIHIPCATYSTTNPECK